MSKYGLSKEKLKEPPRAPRPIDIVIVPTDRRDHFMDRPFPELLALARAADNGATLAAGTALWGSIHEAVPPNTSWLRDSGHGRTTLYRQG